MVLEVQSKPMNIYLQVTGNIVEGRSSSVADWAEIIWESYISVFALGKAYILKCSSSNLTDPLSCFVSCLYLFLVSFKWKMLVIKTVVIIEMFHLMYSRCLAWQSIEARSVDSSRNLYYHLYGCIVITLFWSLKTFGLK